MMEEGSQSPVYFTGGETEAPRGEGLNDLPPSIPCDLSHRTWGWSSLPRFHPHRTRIERPLSECPLCTGRLMQGKGLGQGPAKVLSVWVTPPLSIS